jgi:hypothetical protein
VDKKITHFMTIKEAYRNIAQLEDCTLHYRKWTHNMHLITGLYIYLSYGRRALPEMKERIWRFNEVVGKGNDGTGYHDTLTVFWLWAVRQFCEENNIQKFDESAIGAMLNSAPMQDRKLAENYYEDIDLIVSRRRFMQPPLREMAGVDYFLDGY